MEAQLSEEGKIMLDVDIIWITTGMYEMFMSHGRAGLDGYVLYSHLVYTSRRQGTNSVWAVDNYLQNGLNWGRKRVLAAKKLLKELELIEITQKRDVAGVFQKSYTSVKTSRLWAYNPGCQKPQADLAASGYGTPNALKENINALNKKENAYSEDSDEILLSEKLWANVEARVSRKQKPDMQKWAIHIDRLIRLNGSSASEISDVIDWVEADQPNGTWPGWGAAILSTQNLREKWDKIMQRFKPKEKELTKEQMQIIEGNYEWKAPS